MKATPARCFAVIVAASAVACGSLSDAMGLSDAVREELSYQRVELHRDATDGFVTMTLTNPRPDHEPPSRETAEEAARLLLEHDRSARSADSVEIVFAPDERDDGDVIRISTESRFMFRDEHLSRLEPGS